MAVTNPFSITWGSVTVGGSSTTYLLHGPYVIDKSFTRLRLVFEVIVTASSYATLQSLSDTLEDEFAKRSLALSINIGGSSWTYTHGTDLLNATASATKGSSSETNRGYARSYTCVIEGELPALDTQGLRDMEVHVSYEASRRRVVSMRGVYTAYNGSSASARYLAAFDAQASTILDGLPGDPAFELVSEEYSPDRLDHLCTFSRQYVELLADQSSGTRDADMIRDHRITFADRTQHPGDSLPGIRRLYRTVASYECAIDIDEETDQQAVYRDTVRPHVLSLFQETFDPAVFAIEESSVSYDETSKRMAVQLMLLYRPASGTVIYEATESVAIREMRQIDYTHVHNQNEFAAYADPGVAVRERIWTRLVLAFGTDSPKRRIGEAALSGPAALFANLAAEESVDARNSSQEGKVQRSGWNIVQSMSQVTPKFIGEDQDGAQLQCFVLEESVTERFSEAPSGGGVVTPGGGG